MNITDYILHDVLKEWLLMAEIKIHPVQNKKDVEEFITFPWTVYAADPYWVPPLINERKDFLDSEHNPFFEHARAQYFIAKQG